jgi:hypothetical protein
MNSSTNLFRISNNQRATLLRAFAIVGVMIIALPKPVSANPVVCINPKGMLIAQSRKCSGKLVPASVSAIQSRLTLSTGPSGPAGPAGPAGQAGATGATGPRGAAGVSGRELKTGESKNETIGAQEFKNVVAPCPILPFKVAVGGACSSSSDSISVVSSSVADGLGSFFSCRFKNNSLLPVSNATLTATAVCVSTDD